jgi:hypothetical protein
VSRQGEGTGDTDGIEGAREIGRYQQPRRYLCNNEGKTISKIGVWFSIIQIGAKTRARKLLPMPMGALSSAFPNATI